MKDLIESNMNINGGGLAVNITGKYESNRHAIARMEKLTFGEVVKELSKKKNGAFKISASDLLNAYRQSNGEPEWHHAGFLPKSYGGGMKKTYFLDSLPTISEIKKWLKVASKKRVKKTIKNYLEKIRDEKRFEFLKQNAKRFERVSSAPNFSVKLYWEMNGKFGWFESDSKYKLEEYVSGWVFESEEKLNEYHNL